jgi:hypothetical protein
VCTLCFGGVIPEIDIWRAANLMLKPGEKALEESAARADELAAGGDHNGEATWRRKSRMRSRSSRTRRGRGQALGGKRSPQHCGEHRTAMSTVRFKSAAQH